MNTNIIIFIIILIILIYTLLHEFLYKDYNQTPKKIWTYLDNPDIPKTVTLCMEGWKKYNPEYEIILLTKKNVFGYINIPIEISSNLNFKDSRQFSDLVRLYTLAEHGGIWMDSSILLKAPLEWLFPKYAEFSGFYSEYFTKDTPVIENWFLACNKNSKFIKLWRDEFIQIANYLTVEQYIESRKKMGIDCENIKSPLYLTIHISAQKVLQIDKYPLDSLILRKSEDGPFKYLVDAKWDSEKALQLACSNKKYQFPIMKMRGAEINILENELLYNLSPTICEWI